MNPILFKFLLEEDILEPFIKNRNEPGSVTGITPTPDRYLLDGSFIWDKTPEGTSYWRTIRDKYVKYFIKHKKEN